MKNPLREGPHIDFFKSIQVPDIVQANFALVIRFSIGLLFAYSGLSKLIQPIEYFQVAMGLYELFPDIMLEIGSRIVPWIELLYGTYLLLGYREKRAASALMFLAFLFQIVIGQALLRRIPIDECGCFGGGAVHLTLYQSFLLDTAIILLLNWLYTKSPTKFGFDDRLSPSKSR